MLALVLAFGLAPARAGDPPRTVASISPVHSLVAAVMEGVAEPKLLARGGGSPHVAQLRPSEAAALAAADIVFWIGPALETYLERPLAALGGDARIVALIDSPGLTLHETREGGGRDPHIWLDPTNATAIAAAAAEALAAADPERAATYRANAAMVANSLADLDEEILTILLPVNKIPFLTFHDAYLYFERRYGLSGIGAVAVRIGQPQSARHVASLRARIRDDAIRCIYIETEFAPALVATLTEGSDIKTATLDPLGAGVPPGPHAYAEMLRADARSFADCLGT
jgi:zinc transport system substrate-binding protein